jgi:hypothetical protein
MSIRFVDELDDEALSALQQNVMTFWDTHDLGFILVAQCGRNKLYFRGISFSSNNVFGSHTKAESPKVYKNLQRAVARCRKFNNDLQTAFGNVRPGERFFMRSHLHETLAAAHLIPGWKVRVAYWENPQSQVPQLDEYVDLSHLIRQPKPKSQKSSARR